MLAMDAALDYHGLQAFPEQTLVADGDGVGMLGQLVSLLRMDADPHP